ncbi:MAG: cellulase, partial [Bacteroidota bacterium]|nr:cellulase [Bacteroidota bacterium]
MRKIFLLVPLMLIFFSFQSQPPSWIRINLAGYKPQGIKVAVWGSKEMATIKRFQLIDKSTGKVAFEGKAGNAFGEYGPFAQTYRLDFSKFTRPGTYLL